MAKYTNEQIKKDLKLLSEYSGLNDKFRYALKCSLDLINRQEAEIERLKDYNENLLTANTALSNEILDIKSEAIKEFAERLKEKAVAHNCRFNGVVYDITAVNVENIDNLVKEMVGESK